MRTVAERTAILQRWLAKNSREHEACIAQLFRKMTRLQKLRARRAQVQRALRDIDKPKKPRVPKSRAFAFKSGDGM